MTTRIKHFFMTRAGLDAYTIFLLALFLVFRSVIRMTGLWILAIPAYMVLGYAGFRFFSTNQYKRAEENTRFMGLVQSGLRWLRFRRSVMSDKEHRYFK